jgi:hypothetical protein
LRLTEEQFEFAGVEPDSSAVGTIIDFNVLKLKSEHRIFANRTIHKILQILTAENAEKKSK